MLDLKNLLVCDGRPSKKMIDHIVDEQVNKMVEYFISQLTKPDYLASNTNVADYLNIDSGFRLHTHFSIGAYPKYFFEVVDDVKSSLERYPSFITMTITDTANLERYNKNPNKVPNSAMAVNLLLSINITPEMKKAIILDQELPNNPEDKNRKMKI
jgi:hypothetical protein